MNCCDNFGNCNQGRDCPVRAPAKVATSKPLYRRCDIGGVCPRPDAQCQAECLLSNEAEGQPLSAMEEFIMFAVLALAIGLLLVLVGGAVGYLWGLR